MKFLLPVALLLSATVIISCKKTSDKVTAPINCSGLVTDTASTGNTARIYMPNAFTPNGDGLNDIIRPIGANIQSISFIIYDLNNNVVFSTDQLLQGWSTTATANAAVKYYYKIQAVTSDNHHIGMCGDLYKLSCRPANAPTFYFEDQLQADGFTGTTHEVLANCP